VSEASDLPPFVRIDGQRSEGLLLLCDHASNRVPAAYGDLGLPKGELDRHIGYDIGAAALTRGLAASLDAPALLTTFTRLLIDPNRGEDDPTLIMRLSDGAVVPGNARVDAAERARRIAQFHAPYHDAIDAEIAGAIADGHPPALISMHSFTPVWRGVGRRWHAGVLWDRDDRIAGPLIAALEAEGDLVVGDNEPYAGALVNDTMYRHGTRRGLAHVLIEIRQDLIATEAGVAEWVGRLTPIIDRINRLSGVHDIRQYGSLSGPVSPI
jgi:predicted N-formylglutamate amidohydrolase